MTTETFKVNFVLWGGLMIEEWRGQCLSPEKNPPKRWHAELTDGEVDQLEKDQSEYNTVKQTKLAVKCFEDRCQYKGVVMDFQTASKQQLNVILRDFQKW